MVRSHIDGARDRNTESPSNKFSQSRLYEVSVVNSALPECDEASW